MFPAAIISAVLGLVALAASAVVYRIDDPDRARAEHALAWAFFLLASAALLAALGFRT